MTDEYRDPLAAAHARIAELESENKRLRQADKGRPATTDDLEVLRLEQELMRVDMQWQATAQQRGGNDPKQVGAGLAVIRWMGVALAIVAGLCALLIGAGGLGLAALLVVLGVFFFWLASFSAKRFARVYGEHQAKRAEIERAIARVRGADAPQPQLRVAPPKEAPGGGVELEDEAVEPASKGAKAHR
jgi:hypothetical protein